MIISSLKQPTNVNCENFDYVDSEHQLKVKATEEYFMMAWQFEEATIKQMQAPTLNKLLSRDGGYQCYCKNVIAGKYEGVDMNTYYSA